MFSNSERFAVDNKTAALAVVSLTLEMLLGPGSPAWIWGGGGAGVCEVLFARRFTNLPIY